MIFQVRKLLFAAGVRNMRTDSSCASKWLVLTYLQFQLSQFGISMDYNLTYAHWFECARRVNYSWYNRLLVFMAEAEHAGVVLPNPARLMAELHVSEAKMSGSRNHWGW